MIRSIVLFFVISVSLSAQGAPGVRLGFQAQQAGREDPDYTAGRQAQAIL